MTWTPEPPPFSSWAAPDTLPAVTWDHRADPQDAWDTLARFSQHRITEAGTHRITEDGAIRIIERRNIEWTRETLTNQTWTTE